MNDMIVQMGGKWSKMAVGGRGQTITGRESFI